MITASLIHENAHEVLRLVYSSHDVEVTGQNLRELLVALQEFSVKWVRAVPDRYQLTIASTGQGILSNIRVTALGQGL